MAILSTAKQERVLLNGRNFKYAAAMTGYSEEYLRWLYVESMWIGYPCSVEVV